MKRGDEDNGRHHSCRGVWSSYNEGSGRKIHGEQKSSLLTKKRTRRALETS